MNMHSLCFYGAFLSVLIHCSWSQVALLNSNVNGSYDAGGRCVCSVYLPDNTFPAAKVEQLLIVTHGLSQTVQQQVVKISRYEEVLLTYTSQLQHMTKRVEDVESGKLSYTKLEFQMLLSDIREMEGLVGELTSQINNTIIYSLSAELTNISTIVYSLEEHDTNNVLVMLREVAALKKKLKDCQENRFNGSEIFHPLPGSCNHGGLKNLSKPYMVKLNWRGSSYRSGAWGKDSNPVPGRENLYWVGTDNSYYFRYFRLYSSSETLRPNAAALVERRLPSYYYASLNAVVFQNRLYFQRHGTRTLYSYDLTRNSYVTSAQLPNAVYNNKFSYTGNSYSDIDLAVDENGLWAIYSTDQAMGRIVLSSLDNQTLAVTNTWNVPFYKPTASQGFMVCGVLYLTRPITMHDEEIFFAYDTRTNTSKTMNIVLEKKMEGMRSLDYNPADHKLYMYNNGYLVTYDVIFQM
uniref:olfactomedin-4-like isoform X2 n=1 Tax=Myxine glutinosa TaxID=7769 RepID=UPI00358E378C